MKDCPTEHCLTCSDAALLVKVIQINEENGLALVEVEGQREEVDITLVEHVVPGDLLLVHGGVAIASGFGKAREEIDEIC